jgi:hypothetical protein
VLPDVESPPEDEELTSGANRPRLVLGLLAAALVAGLLTARLVERSGPTAQPAAPTPPVAVSVPQGYPLPLGAAADCPRAGDGEPGCTRSRHVPAAVFAAVRARFPHAHRGRSVEERRAIGSVPAVLWYRALSAIDGQRSIVVEVRRRTATDRPPFASATESGAGLADRMQVIRPAGTRVVVVAVVAPHGQLPTFAAVRRLARDPRLLVASGS